MANGDRGVPADLREGHPAYARDVAKFQLTDTALKKAMDVLGADGKLTLRIQRPKADEFDVSLMFEEETMFVLPTMHCAVGDEIQLGGLKIGMDLGDASA